MSAATLALATPFADGEPYVTYTEHLEHDLDTAVEKVRRYATAVVRVRELHSPVPLPSSISAPATCRHCETRWPCETIRALLQALPS